MSGQLLGLEQSPPQDLCSPTGFQRVRAAQRTVCSIGASGLQRGAKYAASHELLTVHADRGRRATVGRLLDSAAHAAIARRRACRVAELYAL